MHMPKTTVAVAALALVLAAGAAHAADETYDVHIQRPFKVGQEYTLSATCTTRGSENDQMPTGQQQRMSSFRRVVLEADVHVDEVDAKGAEVSDSLVIRKLNLQSSDVDAPGQVVPTREVLPAKSEIVVFIKPGVPPIFATKRAGILSDEASASLQQGFRRISMTDAVYGTAEKKKIGDAWKLNTQALGGDKTSPNYIDPKDVSGTVVLKTLRTLSNLPCVELDATMTTKNFPVEGDTPKEATMTTNFSLNLPVDATMPILAWNVRSTTHVVTESRSLGGGIQRRTVDSEITYEATVAPK